MSELKICRICLNTEVKLHEFDEYKLKECYEQIMAIKLKNNDGLPRYFCYECATLIHKFYKFKKKCELGQLKLKKLIKNDGKMIQQAKWINRTTNLNVSTITNRVKTFYEKHCYPTPKHKPRPRTTTIKPEMVDVTKIDTKPIKTDKDDTSSSSSSDQESAGMNFDSSESDTEDEIPIKKIKIDIEVTKTQPKRESKPQAKRTTKPKEKRERKAQPKRETKPQPKREAKPQPKLKEENWQMVYLTDEEALQEFQARANDLKYTSAVYKCTSCLKGFSREEMMKRHNKLRHSESNGPVECRFCHIRFKYNCLLDRHIREHYNKYKCLRCDLVFSRETSALHHDQFHNGVTRTCEYCNETFKHLSTYYTHLRKHRSKHVCPVCGESFVSQFGLKVHKKVKHIVGADKQEDTTEETTYCEKCDIKFENNKAYEEHLTHSTMHSESGELAPPMNLKGGSVLRRRATRRQTLCSICNKTFGTFAAYTKHHHVAHPKVPFPRPAPGQERVICEICGALLAANSMHSHLNTHTRKRQYTCTTCGMKFNTRGILRRHFLTHTGEKPVECPLCDKRFTQPGSMKLHYRTIHLKQPYPKRKKKTEETEESTLIAEYYQNKETPEELPLERWRTSFVNKYANRF